MSQKDEVRTDMSELLGEDEQRDEAALLECLSKVGKALVASGSAAGLVENTLAAIALSYRKDCEIVALPNVLMIKLGASGSAPVHLTMQRLTHLQLDQLSEIGILVDRVLRHDVPLLDAASEIDRILIKVPRFRPVVVIVAYALSSIGLTMLFRPEPRALLVSGLTGIVAGSIILWFRNRRRFDLLLPVIAAIVISAIVFNLTRLGLLYGPTNLLIPPLVTFLPGVVLTTGMIELASMHILSGSARLVYGAAVLFFLLFGIAIGQNLSGLGSYLVLPYEAVSIPWWA
ncbi:MAG: threonine/serine exporter family protein, partial [Caldilineaceae bacterium]|nr:threonine/serine exporter family protein [Caldilineaceae bacterium]